MLSIGFTALEEVDKLFFVFIVIVKAIKFIVSPPLFSLFMSSVSFTLLIADTTMNRRVHTLS